MKRHHIPIRKRVALWRAHGKRCVYCGEPLWFADLWLDHILPEQLSQNPLQLDRILREYELGPDFSIDDYCNWLPSHQRCNRQKGQTVFERGTARYYINIAQSRSRRACEEEKRFAKSLKADEVLSRLGTALESGLVTKEEATLVLRGIPEAAREAYDPIIVTFGLTVDDVLKSGLLGKGTPTHYPALCDWLEQDLVVQLKSLVSCPFYYTEASARDGESLSVRLAFVQLDLDELESFASPWWAIRELAPYSEIY